MDTASNRRIYVMFCNAANVEVINSQEGRLYYGTTKIHARVCIPAAVSNVVDENADDDAESSSTETEDPPELAGFS